MLKWLVTVREGEGGGLPAVTDDPLATITRTGNKHTDNQVYSVNRSHKHLLRGGRGIDRTRLCWRKHEKQARESFRGRPEGRSVRPKVRPGLI